MSSRSRQAALPKISLLRLRKLDTARATRKGRGSFVSAASGLVMVGSTFYVVTDDELHLAYFERDPRKKGNFHRLFPGHLAFDKKARKTLKPDLESLCLFSHAGALNSRALLAVPSGSTSRRCQGALVKLDSRGIPTGRPRIVDFTPLYSCLTHHFSELNIEGVVAGLSTIQLFQRGNGLSGRNAVIELDENQLRQDLSRGSMVSSRVLQKIRPYTLGKLRGDALAFTDAASAPGGETYFIAVCEAGGSTYLDGAFGGAILGRFTPRGRAVVLAELAIREKPEGIWISPDGKYFYVVTDGDNEKRPSHLYRAHMPGSSKATRSKK